ncbi:MAG: helicase-associated domain-containing protein, partial [Anaerolineae bacterium]
HSPLTLDLFAYLVHVQTHDVRSARPGLPLDGGDPDRRDLILHLAARLGFVVQEEGLLRLDAAPVKRWLTATPGRQITTLHEAWRDDPTWVDLCRVPGLTCDEATPWLHRYDPAAARRALLALLARCPAAEWWTVDSFVDAVHEVHPDFQRPDGDYGSWYIRDVDSGDYLSGFGCWDAVEGTLIRDLLARALPWLDVVQVVPGPSGPAARLTAAGRRFLGLAPAAPQEAPSPPITIRPDMLVEVPTPANLYTCFQLERFADAVGRRAAGPWRYRLTVGGLGRALGRGVRVEQILAFLRQASDEGLPVNVAGQLQLWAGRYGQVELEEMALLTARSERALKELSVLPETRPLIGRILSPTTALVRQAHLPRLRKALRDLGFLPPEPDAP